MGFDTTFDFNREKKGLNASKTINAVLIIKKEDLPSSSFMGRTEEKLQKEIHFYENELLPKLKSLGSSDITGEYTFGEQESNGRRMNINIKNVPEIIDSLMQ